MAPKLPGKFDDISKTASSLLGDDFQCKGCQLKTKQKTQLDGATSEVTVDFAGAGECRTPAKLNFKFPKPFGLKGFSIDKLELDSKSVGKAETSISKDMHGIDGMKIDVKCAPKDVAMSITYTGIADTSVKVESKNFSAAKYNLEVLHGLGDAVFGAKLDQDTLCPNVGVNYQSGPFFVSVFAKKQFSAFTLHKHYKVSDDIKVAATYDFPKNSWSVGGSFNLGDITAKAKVNEAQLVSAAFKTDLAKGLSLNAGGSYNIASGAYGFGAKVSIE